MRCSKCGSRCRPSSGNRRAWPTCAAELLVALERQPEARRIVEDALAHNWDARLLRRYPDTAGGDALPLIQKAEGWKKDHPDDAELLFALGRLCQKQQLWGKAQSFLEAALKLADSEALKVRAHRALARLFEHLGEPGEGRAPLPRKRAGGTGRLRQALRAPQTKTAALEAAVLHCRPRPASAVHQRLRHRQRQQAAQHAGTRPASPCPHRCCRWPA